MIRINQMKVVPAVYADEEKRNAEIEKKILKLLHIQKEQMLEFRIAKQSIDARKKPEIYYTLAVDVKVKEEEAILNWCKDSNVMKATTVKYHFPKAEKQAKPMKNSPIIIGSGPAGLFCAYQLAIHGYRPIVLERGADADTRKAEVTRFWETGTLTTNSNVQFGEGGAGTFSDGKLNTLVKDKEGRGRAVLDVFVKAGAPDKITFENKPHLGTDSLISIVKNMRDTIERQGGEVRFQSEVTDFLVEENQIKGVVINGTETLESEIVVLAIGHSARNTMECLHQKGIPMEAKSFAVGLRVEQKQTTINHAQYGIESPEYLPPADYKVAGQTSNGRGVYSFCMCPGGYVVNASSETGELNVNGMSYSKRDGIHANSAVIVSVTPEDYQSTHPLAGIYFQQKLEKKAFEIGNGKIPVQYYGDFKKNKASDEKGQDDLHSIKGAYTYANVRSILPEVLNESFIEGMEKFNRTIKGFADSDTLVLGIESRTSSPVRIPRDETLQSTVRGLYPCGEGAGYAGGITSAAIDGMKTAEEIAKNFLSC